MQTVGVLTYSELKVFEQEKRTTRLMMVTLKKSYKFSLDVFFALTYLLRVIYYCLLVQCLKINLYDLTVFQEVKTNLTSSSLFSELGKL